MSKKPGGILRGVRRKKGDGPEDPRGNSPFLKEPQKSRRKGRFSIVSKKGEDRSTRKEPKEKELGGKERDSIGHSSADRQRAECGCQR